MIRNEHVADLDRASCVVDRESIAVRRGSQRALRTEGSHLLMQGTPGFYSGSCVLLKYDVKDSTRKDRPTLLIREKAATSNRFLRSPA